MAETFKAKPLVHAYVHEVSTLIRKACSNLRTSEFWHIPKNAVFSEDNAHGIYDWILAESVLSEGGMINHRVLFAIEYKTNTHTTLWPPRDGQSAVVLTLGHNERGTSIAKEAVTAYKERPRSKRYATFLKIPSYQQKLRSSLKGSELIALQEVALSEIGELSDDMRSFISMKSGIPSHSDHWVPGRRRFDLILATLPPMSRAVAAIEIDGSTHKKEDLGDQLKNIFCKQVGLPLIRIEIGGHLPTSVNRRQDEFLPRIATWLKQTILSPSFEISTLPEFFSFLEQIARTANPEARNDLLALVSHSKGLFNRLRKSIGSVIGPNVPSPMNFNKIDYRYQDFYQIGYPEHANSVVDTTAKCVRQGDDLFINIRSDWGGATGGLKDPLFPKQVQIGPLRIRVIANREFRERFYYFAETELATEYHKLHNDEALRALKIDSEDAFDQKVMEWQLFDDLVASEGQFSKLLLAIHQFGIRKPEGSWDEVEWSPYNIWSLGEKKPKHLWGEPRDGRWYRAPKNKCIEFWRNRQSFFLNKKENVLQIMESKKTQLDPSIRDDVMLILDDVNELWLQLEQWSQDEQ